MHREVNVPKESTTSCPGMSMADCCLHVAGVAGEFLLLTVKIVYITICAIARSIFPKSKKDLCGEIVLITGAAQGLGRQLALDIANLGAKVILWDINEEKLKETADLIKESGRQAWWYVCDVTSEKQIQAKAEVVSKDVGDVTILINNAGILQNVPLLELDSQKIELTFKVNILAHFWTIRAFLPKMKENNYGHIAAIASAAGIMGHVNQSDYSASKFAVVGLMEALSEEMRLQNCKVSFTTICPLTVDTGMNRHPVTKYPILTPILSIKDAARLTIDAIRREEFLAILPGSSGCMLRMIKIILSSHTTVIQSLSAVYDCPHQRLFPQRVMSEVMDTLEYCRISNAVPTEREIENR